MIQEYSKYNLYRKYKTEDGVNYIPLDEYQALADGSINNCDCGYREYEYRWNGIDYICGSILIGDNPTLTINSVEGNWTRNDYTFTSNTISHNQTTVEKIYFQVSKPSNLLFTINQSSEICCDYLIIGNLDTSVTSNTGSSYNYCNWRNKTTGTTSMTINDTDMHYIELMYKKDDGASGGTDNVIVTLSIENIYDSTSIYEVWREWAYCPEDTSYDELTGIVDYRFPQKSYDCDWVTYKWEVIDGEYVCAESNVITFKTTQNSGTTNVYINENGKSIPINDGVAYVNITKDLGIETLTSCNSTFSGKTSMTELLTFPDTSSVTDMYGMFSNCSALLSLDASMFDTSSVTNMNYMFSGCSSLPSLDLSTFDTSNVTNMHRMFASCSGLTSLDLSNWNTSNVIYMGCMFSGCSNLPSIDVSTFDTSNVTSMYEMFNGCNGLISLDLSNFNTSSVTNMTYMFSNCSSLPSIDLSTFDTSSVTNMSYMFQYCRSLTSLNLSTWDLSSVTNMNYMFNGCSNLKYLILNDITQDTYDKIYNALTSAGIEDNVIITYNIIN